MKWTQQRLKRLGEVNLEKKIPRYFEIKKLVEEIVKEEVKEEAEEIGEELGFFKRKKNDIIG